MPLVVCPGCGRHIDLPYAELSLPSIQCAVCDTFFCPASWPAASPPQPVHRGAMTGCVVLTGVVLLSAVLVIVLLIQRSDSLTFFDVITIIQGWYCFACVALALAHVLLVVWMASDVRARDPERAPLWFFVLLLGGFIGLIFWLFARPPLRH